MTQSSAGGGTGRARDIVLCCDGTSNTLTGGRRDTNVLRLHALLSRPVPDVASAPERVVAYLPGVGNAGALPAADLAGGIARGWHRLSGLAFGGGAFEQVAEGYRLVMTHWRGPQDRLFLFGFSRGAFVARAIAGVVDLFGILPPGQDALVDTLVHTYFTPPADSHDWRARAMRRLHRLTGHEATREDVVAQVRAEFMSPERRDAWVHWVGAFDTVESVGMPAVLSLTNVGPSTFTDRRFRHVRHALALDEHRWPFLPRLYHEPGDLTLPDPAAGSGAGVAAGAPSGTRTLRQRWFPGVHTDVGGSEPVASSGLPDAALRWMLVELAEEMAIDPHQPLHEGGPQPQAWRHDAMWDTPAWALAGMVVRDMRPRVHERVKPHAREPIAVIPAIAPDAVVHSVWERRRPLAPALAAAAIGLVALVVSGYCLLPPGERFADFAGAMTALDAPGDFAGRQLAAVVGEGLLAREGAPWSLPGQPAWSMAWDLVFIACWGYLLARVASRAWAWMAGEARPGQRAPRWRWLGFAPMVAVLGDVGEDLLTLAALAVHGLGSDLAASLLLWLASLGSLAKFGGLAACLPFVVVRVQIAMHPHRAWPAAQARMDAVRRVPTRRHRHRIAQTWGALALVAATWVTWMAARVTVCQGGHGWLGDLACSADVVGFASAALMVGLFAWLAADVVRGRSRPGLGSDLPMRAATAGEAAGEAEADADGGAPWRAAPSVLESRLAPVAMAAFGAEAFAPSSWEATHDRSHVGHLIVLAVLTAALLAGLFWLVVVSDILL